MSFKNASICKHLQAFAGNIKDFVKTMAPIKFSPILEINMRSFFMLDVTSIFNRPANTIIFADSTLPDLATLQAGFPANAEVYLLPAGCDGLLFIADTLARRSGIEAIHLLTHGAPGVLQIGAISLNSLNLTRYTSALDIISNAMVEDGQWLIYGCDVAQGAEGQRFVQALRLMTGLQVAAASHKVGAEELGGSWELDYGMIGQQKILTIPQWQGVLALPGAHSATAAGEVFLGGNFIELGISAVGSFGTVGNKPAGFYGTTGSTQIGMGNDADGFGVGVDLRIDYFIPGNPEERWGVGYNGSTYGSYSKLASNAGAALTATSLTNTSIGSNLGATFTGTVGAALIVSQAISFGVDDKIFKNTVTLTNTTGATLTGVTYMRSFDPDNTQFYNSGGYITINTIENTFALDGKSVISAKSPIGEPYYVDAGNKQATILFYTTEAGASTYLGGSTNPFSLTSPGAKGTTVTGDKNIW